MGVFDNFVSLDGLIQVIYHSTSCFVLISNVETERWVVELGLVGNSGCWWKGSWSEKDVLRLAGAKVSERALESFSTRLTNHIVAGELAIGDWNVEHGVEIKLQIDPTGSTSVTIILAKLPTEEGSARAVNILKGIALQAQSRGCRINGVEPSSPSFVTSIPKLPELSNSKEDKELRRAQERIKRLETEVTQVKQLATDKLQTSPSKPTAPKPPPGASRANPTRQKRKIVEAEFESD